MHPVRGPPRVQQEKEPLLPPKAPQRGAGLALAAVQPPRWPRTAGSFRDSPELQGLPASGTGSCWGPTTHPDTPRRGWHLEMLMPTATHGIQHRQRDAQSHSQPPKASSRPSAFLPKNSPSLSALARRIHPIAALAPSLPKGACTLLQFSCVSLSPTLDVVLGLAIKSLN